jgi:Mlc titration factor MtfA (ptsG expression regulator)
VAAVADRLQRARAALFAERRRRRRVLREGFADRWRPLLAAQVAAWPALDRAQRERLERLTVRLLASFRWEAARGSVLTEAMAVTIAAHAALMLLGLPDDSFDDVTSVIVHPSTMFLRGPRPGPVPGVFTDAPLPIAGQTTHRGPVVLAWDAVRRESLHPEWGEHVVLHEFAHRLDMADGTIDGTPPFQDRADRAHWVEVCTPVFDDLRHGGGHPVLRPYGGVNPGEFFAVATEAFFTRGADLQVVEPDLYAVFADWYGQHPASWRPATLPPVPVEGPAPA